MIIKKSTIFKFVIVLVTMYTLGFLDMVMPAGNTDLNRVIVGGVGILLTLATLVSRKKGAAFRRNIRFANRFFALYLPIIALVSVLSLLWYKYQFMSMLAIVMPYCFPLYAYPLLYIFSVDKTYKKFMKVVVALVVLILSIKAFAWYLYNFQHITIFPGLLLRHSADWVRNGVLRVDVGALYGVALCYLLSMFFVDKNRKAGIAAGGMMLFVVFITQYRYLEIVMLLAALIVYLTSTDSNKRELIRILLLVSAVILFIAFGGLDAILASFSVENKDYGSSNEARLLTIDYFWNQMDNFQHVVGLGFLYSYSPRAAAILTRSETLTYWMEDIGILGGFFTFGFLCFLIYGPLFIGGIKASVIAIKNKLPDRAYLASLVGYMILCCIMLNILDRQRLYDTAFYVAVISFISATIEQQPSSPLLRRKKKAES